MGATYVTVSIRNPADLDRCWEGLFRIDAGAIDSLVPGPHLDAIGLKPEGKRVYELADGNEVVMDVTIADIEFMGQIVGGTILYGAPDAHPRPHRSGIGRHRGRSRQSAPQEAPSRPSQEPRHL